MWKRNDKYITFTSVSAPVLVFRKGIVFYESEVDLSPKWMNSPVSQAAGWKNNQRQQTHEISGCCTVLRL